MKKLINVIYNSFTFDVALCIILSVFVLLKGELFIVHPFYLVLLALCANYRFRSYVAFNLVTILLSFIFSYEYGFMITIINSVFFLLKISVNSFVNNAGIKDNAPYLITSLLLNVYLVSLNTEFENIINTLLFFSISLIAFYAFSPMVKNIKYKTPINNKNRILSFCLFPLFFITANPFIILIFQALHIFYLKTLKQEESLICMLISSFLVYYMCKIDAVLVFSLIVPFVISWFFFSTHSLIFYALFYLVYETLFVKAFYLDENFYQSLIAIILGIFISQNGYEKAHVIFYQESENKNQEKNVISNIKKYINLVLSPKLEAKDEPKKKVLTQFSNNLCSDCKKAKNCSLITLQEKSLQSKLNQQERGYVLNMCQTPYKFFKQSEIMRDIYIREHEKVNRALEFQNAYKKELGHIYTPLLLLEKEETSALTKLKELLYEDELNIIDIVEFKDEIEIRIAKYDQEDIQLINDKIFEVYQKTSSFSKSAYSFSSGCYILLFTFKMQYKVDYFYSLEGINPKSGDYVKIKIENNKLIFLLSDGMGHSTYSSSLSEFLIESILTFSTLNSDFATQIQTANNLLYNKSTQESYATLDYLTIDLVNLKFNLFKAGSFPNYIYHSDRVKESKKNFPPLGILKDITPFAYQDRLALGDVLIFLSDGFNEDVKDIISTILSCGAYLSAKEIHRQLLSALKSESLLVDDKALVVLKIEKND